MVTTVLIVGSDKATTKSYANFFNKRDYTIFTAHSGRQALAHAKVNHLDAIVVDTTSPRINCKSLSRKLRNQSSAPLILIIQPGIKLTDPIPAAGVLHKPVLPKKLVARVKSAIDEKPPRLLTRGQFSLDLEKQKLSRGTKTFSLTPKEFILLKVLMGRVGQTITRKTLMKEVWDTEYLGDTRTLDVHVRWVREKLEEDPSQPQYLITVRGQGYRFELDIE